MRLCALYLIVFFSVGCGSDQVDTYPVSGKVEFSDGSPVRHGTIEFSSVDHGTTASGKIEHDGSFVLGTYTPNDGAAEGKQDAIIIQLLIADGSFEHTIDHGKSVPVKYGDYDTSSLAASVEAIDQNEVVITIDDE